MMYNLFICVGIWLTCEHTINYPTLAECEEVRRSVVSYSQCADMRIKGENKEIE